MYNKNYKEGDIFKTPKFLGLNQLQTAGGAQKDDDEDVDDAYEQELRHRRAVKIAGHEEDVLL